MDTAILAANAAFYEAFHRNDAVAMDEIWAARAPVACIHPGRHALLGRNLVMASWRAILEHGAVPVRCVAPQVQHLGEAAVVICEEHVDGNRLIATNVFVHEDGRWRIVHHQAGPLAPGERSSAPTTDPGGLN